MSLVFGDEMRDKRMALIFKMLDEMTEALDESTPLTRRRSIVYKWCVLLRAMGLYGGECTLYQPPAEMERQATRLLEAASNVLRQRWPRP